MGDDERESLLADWRAAVERVARLGPATDPWAA